MKKRFVFLLVLILSGVALWRTDGFSPAQIEVPLLAQRDAPFPLDFSIPETFHYLGRGRQAFVFESGDWVIKFFNRSDLNKPIKLYFPKLLKSPKKEEIRWREKLRIYPESYPLAQKYLSEETGVVYVHLGQSDKILPTIQLIDRAFRHFSIDLNQVPFVLQRKGSGSFYKELKGERIDEMIDAFLKFHAKRIALHIADYDRDIKRNYCWNGSSIQYIDPARFFYEPRLDQPKRKKLEWWKATHRLRKWLVNNAPDKVGSFDAKLKAMAE